MSSAITRPFDDAHHIIIRLNEERQGISIGRLFTLDNARRREHDAMQDGFVCASRPELHGETDVDVE